MAFPVWRVREFLRDARIKDGAIPLCMLTNVFHALNVLLSHRPDEKQVAIRGMSAY